MKPRSVAGVGFQFLPFQGDELSVNGIHPAAGSVRTAVESCRVVYLPGMTKRLTHRTQLGCGFSRTKGRDDMPVETVVVEAEHDAISEGREIIEGEQNANNWRLGELASQLHEAGQTDQQIADAWDCSKSRVRQCRAVWENFSGYRGTRPNWGWRCYRTMLNWDDAAECIEWASETQATFRETEAWRRARNGENLRESPVQAPTTVAAEPNQPIVAPSEPPQAPATESASNVPQNPPEAPQDPIQEPETLVGAPSPRQPEPEAGPVSSVPDFLSVVREAVQGLQRLTEAPLVDDERQQAAAMLRQLADELDPPAVEGEMVRRTAQPQNCPTRRITERFNEVFGARCRLTSTRLRAMRQRWRDEYWRNNWEAALTRASQSAFLTGTNDRGWTMDLEFFLRPDSVTKILEGKYDGRTGNGTSRAHRREQQNAGAFAEVFGPAEGTADTVLDEGTGRIHPSPIEDMGGGSDNLPF